jgi:hypothetical protein
VSVLIAFDRCSKMGSPATLEGRIRRDDPPIPTTCPQVRAMVHQPHPGQTVHWMSRPPKMRAIVDDAGIGSVIRGSIPAEHSPRRGGLFERYHAVQRRVASRPASVHPADLRRGVIPWPVLGAARQLKRDVANGGPVSRTRPGAIPWECLECDVSPGARGSRPADGERWRGPTDRRGA